VGADLRKRKADFQAEANRKNAEDRHETTFHPDPSIFEKATFSYDMLAQRLREMAFLNKGLRLP